MANDSIIFGIGGDTSGLQQSLNRATSAVSAATSKMASGGFKQLLAPLAGVVASVGSVTAVMAGMKGALDLGGELTDLSNRTGVAVESLYGLRQGFKDAGVDAEKLGPAVNKMQKALSSAVGGGKEADVLKSMGLDPQSLASMDSGQAFAQIGNAIAQLPNSTERAAASMALFGKSGGELLQVFMDPAFKNAGNISETAKLLGQNAGIFDKASDSLGRVGPKLQGLFVGVASGMTGLLDSLANGIDRVDLTTLGKNLGTVAGNFSTNWKAAAKNALDDISKLIGFALSGDALKLFGIELVIQGSKLKDALFSAFREPLNYFAAFIEKITNKAHDITFKGLSKEERGNLKNSEQLSIKQRDDAFFKEEELTRKKKLMPYGAAGGKELDAQIAKQQQIQKSAEANILAIQDRLKNNGKLDTKSVDQIAAENKAGGIDYVADAKAAADANRSALQDSADQIKARLSTQFDGIKFSSFTPTAATLAANAKATADNANRGNKDTTFNPADIGQAAAVKQSIFADSLAKVGGGGISIGGGGNPILEENKRQTGLLQKIHQSLSKGSQGQAEFAPA
jgi:hypothetical protein